MIAYLLAAINYTMATAFTYTFEQWFYAIIRHKAMLFISNVFNERKIIVLAYYFELIREFNAQVSF
jgi:hypothetical protein